MHPTQWPSRIASACIRSNFSLVPKAPRGAIVWVCGVYTALTGLFGYVLQDQSDRKSEALRYQTAFLSPQDFGYVMIVLGLLVAFLAYCPRGRDRIGLGILCGWSTLWGLSFLASALIFDAGLSSSGPFLVWTVLVLGVLLVAATKLSGGERAR